MPPIVIPTPTSELHDVVWPHSGLVASEYGDTDRIRVDFEGDGDRFPTWADRVWRAAERHQWAHDRRGGYPTRACAYVPPDAVRVIGHVGLESGTVRVDDRESLASWLDVGELPDEELERTR